MPNDTKEPSEEKVQSGEEKDTDDNKETTVRIALWAVFGVFISIVPILLGMLYDWLSGYNLAGIKLEYYSDFFLVVVAVAGNACNCAIAWKTEKYGKRIAYIVLTAFIIVFGIGLFSFWFRNMTIIVSERADICFMVSIVAFLANALMGVLIEKDI